MDVHGLRALYDDEMPRRVEPPAGMRREECDGLTWMLGPGPSPLDHMVCHSRLGPADAVRVVRAEVARARAAGHGLQWNAFGHDEPAGLAGLLRAEGLAVQSEETVLVAPSADPRFDAAPPPGVDVASVRDAAGLDALLAVQEAVWGPTHTPWHRRWFQAVLRGEGPPLAMFVAFAGGRPVGTAWVSLRRGRSFAGLYGGTVVPDARRRGVHRALVAARARAAREAGLPYVVAGANAQSGPRLRALGFAEIATCTELVLEPPGRAP
jgi:GNAT superfamily N-acetyltransferase